MTDDKDQAARRTSTPGRARAARRAASTARSTEAAGAPISALVGEAGNPAAGVEAALAEERAPKPDASAASSPLKKKDFVSEVVARTGLKRGDARKAVEASFALLGESLLESRSLSLPPFAKIKPMRQKEGGEASILTVKMRIKGSSDEPAETPLADPEDTR